MDWIAGRHIPLPRKRERGHLDSEQHAEVPWLFCVSHLLSPSPPRSSLTFRESFQPQPCPQHSTTHCPVHLSACQPFCSTDHLPVMCPCPQLEKPAGEKVKIFIIRSTRVLRDGQGRTERSSSKRTVMGWRLDEKSLNISETEEYSLSNSVKSHISHIWRFMSMNGDGWGWISSPNKSWWGMGTSKLKATSPVKKCASCYLRNAFKCIMCSW